jgi:hypothetical protein
MTPKPDWWTSDEWATPSDVFERIARVYGPFDLDVCCRSATAKANRYFIKEEDYIRSQWARAAVDRTRVGQPALQFPASVGRESD